MILLCINACEEFQQVQGGVGFNLAKNFGLQNQKHTKDQH
jgi:hypothetical protein